MFEAATFRGWCYGTNINDLDKNISGKNKVDIYLFVKNGFEEYTYKSQNYKISLTVKIELNGGKYNNSTNDLTFNNVDYNKLDNVIKEYYKNF